MRDMLTHVYILAKQRLHLKICIPNRDILTWNDRIQSALLNTQNRENS